MQLHLMNVPLTGLAQFLRFCLTTFSFVKILVCSYEKAGWPGYQDLGFSSRDIGNQAGNLSHMNSLARLLGWIIFNYECFARSLTKLNAASDIAAIKQISRV